MNRSQLSKRVQKLKNETLVSRYKPVLILRDSDNIENYKNLIGPKTVVIIDDIPNG